MTGILLFVFMLVAVPAPAAQKRDVPAPPPPGGPGPQGPSGVRPNPRPAPRIDPLTAVIRGRITTADTGAPVRRAEVRAVSDRGAHRLATTDGDGRYELRNLPAGDFTLAVSRTGFVSLKFGQRFPTEAPVVIPLAEGKAVTADVALPRGGAIAGRVYDVYGEPLAHVRVEAMPARVVEGRRRFQTLGGHDETDDLGAFRLYGLTPGDYYVVARPRATQGDMGYARASSPIYFPGTTNFEEAQPIRLGVGTEANADMQLTSVRTVRVSGLALNSSGAPAADAIVNLASDAVQFGPGGVMPMVVGSRALADGTFMLLDVPPGAYTLNVNFQTGGGFPPFETAALPITVGAQDVSGITVSTSTGGSVSATFARDDGVTQPLPRELRVNFQGSRGGASLMRVGGTAGGFQMAGLSGPFRIAVEGLPDGWAVKAVTVNDVDVTDAPIDLRSGQSLSARIVLTDRVTEVTGTVTARNASRSSVVVFPEDSAKWTYPSRYMRTARADEAGRFRITGLPAGERYRVVAVDYLEEGEGGDPEFLERMRDLATSLTLREGERRTLDLRGIQR